MMRENAAANFMKSEIDPDRLSSRLTQLWARTPNEKGKLLICDWIMRFFLRLAGPAIRSGHKHRKWQLRCVREVGDFFHRCGRSNESEINRVSAARHVILEIDS